LLLWTILRELTTFLRFLRLLLTTVELAIQL